MFGVRDVVWSVALCAALTFFFHYRPLWSARHFVTTESDDAFRDAYRGHRWRGGQIITPRGQTSTSVDPMAPLVRAQSVDILAEETSWNGDRAELIVRQRVVIEDGSQDGHAKQSVVYVKLERASGHWRYAHFEERGEPPLATPIVGNPFSQTL